MTMPWAYYHGLDVGLEQKLDGMERFAADILVPLGVAPARPPARPPRRARPPDIEEPLESRVSSGSFTTVRRSGAGVR